MEIFMQFLFLAIAGTVAYFVRQRYILIKKTISLGKSLDLGGQVSERIKMMLLLAFGQKKMFNRPIVGLLHFVVYIGFVIINIEILEIMIDGIFGTHRIFLGLLGTFYTYLIGIFEFLALGVILACIVFLIRRNVTKVERLQAEKHRELRGWAVLDANIILISEIVLMWCFLSMNAADVLLQERGFWHYDEVITGNFYLSQYLKPLFSGFSDITLFVYERLAWWIHIVGIFLFALYVSYSKHLHIILAFPNTYFSRLKPIGEIENMPTVTAEVKSMLGLGESDSAGQEIGRFGAKDVHDLTWKNLMDAYSCSECGRCTSVCPANMTGKQLSPRKIMMDTRDRLEDLQKNWLKSDRSQAIEKFDDGKTLLNDYISEEELLACTTCNACVQECPINISPLDIIIQLRRYNIMEESKAPSSWNALFSNLENNMAPWKFSPSDRANWISELNK